MQIWSRAPAMILGQKQFQPNALRWITSRKSPYRKTSEQKISEQFASAVVRI
ncbi:MAG TPA: hypothetical protein VJ723_00740 [Candidatus Angelobacter sp.]|nr:hypothetical protein [Candidatus Angelobacter sp.]